MVLEDFILPDIGEGIVECELVEWRIQEGDVIAEDQPIADVSTDKALVEITSMHNGRVKQLYYQQGEIAKVHTPLFSVEIEANGSAERLVDSADTKTTDTKTTDTKTAATKIVDNQNSIEKIAVDTQKVLATPAVRRIARENDLDLSQVPSSGKHGRVLKEDALNYLHCQSVQNSQSGQQLAGQRNGAELMSQPRPTLAKDFIEPIKGVRAVMAKTMMDSVATIPHFTYADDIDMTQLIALRAELKTAYAEQGIRLTMMPFFIKALSLAIKQFPILNSRVNAECTEIEYLRRHHIGIAVDSPAGLLVPNIKDVQDKTIVEVAECCNRLTEQARAGRVSPDDLRCGTITLSNIGAIGGTVATPIINKPEVAIVALGKVQALPRFDTHGQVVQQQLMTASWSGDHRVIDGATMARFSNTWKGYLEAPASMLMVMN